MEKLRAHVHGEVMSVELDVEGLGVPADSVATLEEDDIALPVEQPGHRHAGHTAADDRDRAPRRRRLRQHRRTRGRGNRFEHIAAGPGGGHRLSSAICGATLSRVATQQSTRRPRGSWTDESRAVDEPAIQPRHRAQSSG
jgi:hypothetical protein